MGDSIRLHPVHGVNPTIPTCFLCGESKNELVLLGAAYKGEAPMKICLDKTPCDKCKGFMAKGIIFISIRNGEPQSDNPYRTGAWCVVTEEAFRRWPLDEASKEDGLKSRVMFIEDGAWDKLGLPRENIPEKKEEGE